MGAQLRASMAAQTVGESDKVAIDAILKDIFQLMDANNDGSIDQDEGVAMGQAMGESAEQAKKSWKAMAKDMDDDENATIELEGWQKFYKQSLKDAPLDDVLNMLEQMKETIAKYNAEK